ncbi:MAG: tRNA pseudouridine(38-40) synthase TruA, partial [Spirochaetia bacterium]|nr:tRNA pseudouridine(38-40) synthase TruA [Spirochaetia bacterium]
MFHYKLIVAYDGTNYQGFQRQKNGIGVQQVIEKALTKLFKEPVELVAAGRTDAGVHARGQVVSFTTQKNIPAEKLPQALGHLLPKDVVILEGTSVDANFHARYGAVAKTYEYKIYLADQLDPCQRNYTWQLQEQLDVPAMEEATQYI